MLAVFLAASAAHTPGTRSISAINTGNSLITFSTEMLEVYSEYEVYWKQLNNLPYAPFVQFRLDGVNPISWPVESS